ncbi:ABC transporter ATP-binding protein [Thiolinea disciformis]|uniref:ABC transporter ATP-binding protein n=1 Tax=Thiolinea disciformis TaxID=125614 RepID=UPI00037AF3AA|nr:ABC transporter ATP-binding protein [Thiolinea disciformis]
MDILFREYGRVIWQKKWWFLLTILSVASANLITIIVPLFYKDVANGLAAPFSALVEQQLFYALSMIALCYLAIWLSWRLVEIAVVPFEAGGMNLLDKRNFQVVLKQRYSFFENNFAGSLVKQATRFTRSFEAIMDWLIFQLMSNTLAITVSFIIFYQQQPTFSLYFLTWIGLFLVWSIGFSIWKLKYNERTAAWDSKLAGIYADNISNIFIVKSFALETQESQRVSNTADSLYRARRIAWLLEFVNFGVQGALTFALELALVYAMISEWREGHFEIGEYVLFQSIILVLINRMWDFGRNFRAFFTAIADAREMAEVFRQVDLEEDAPTTQSHKISQGQIEFRNIGFRYNVKEGPDTLFEQFDLTIRAGEKVALVGHSGSGKTSLTKLLFRFIDPQTGQVLFDGIDAKNFTLHSLRTQISLIPQQPELFHRSIRDNIALDKEVSDEQLRHVAQKARALEFIERLPQGFDTLVGERGVKLSGGEKQRVAIARAFLEDAPIVVLDEATSALDSITEQDIQVAIFELIQDKTAIVIAHRLATILRMDRIIVLDQGHIIEQGTHQELLEQQGHYYRMWQHQSGEFLAD